MTAVQTYAQDIAAKYASGKATEHTYRSELEHLLVAIGGDDTQAINEPKRQGSNAPDYYVHRNLITVGFVEAKDLDKDLDVVEKSDQLDRYREAYSNLLLTNQLEFRWYIDGEFSEGVTIGKLDGKVIRFDTDAYGNLDSLLRRYYEATAPTIYKPADLAERMAKMARELARLIENALENPKADSDLPDKKEAVERVLIPNMTNRQFADMFAQTIAYGLFAARARFTGKPEQFTLETAFFQLPKSNPFLQKLFQNLAANLDTRVKFMADLISQLLAYAKGLDDVIANFGHSTRQQDPVIHFYEDFLNAYDSKQRERRGVYYTPEPVVSYIVRSVDHILKTTFGRTDGLADTETLILDPATGTGTFLYQVIQHIHDSMAGNMGMWKSYVQKHLLPRIFGFELLMAPYTVAHMKLNLLLSELGYDFSKDDRLQIYLTNTLEENVAQPSLPFAEYLTDEANAATRVKRDEPIMVVLGNPPYSKVSANWGDWIQGLLQDYYKVDGKPLGERTVWLQDDYVKFFRFGQWRIEQTGSGVLAFVTNHGYLDNVTFRGMRQQLMNTFTDIYIINLHGNTYKREITPDGDIDQNVFDIMQGVAIGIFVKDKNKSTPAKIRYIDVWGKRASKYDWLSNNKVDDDGWESIEPSQPFYLFIPQDKTMYSEYEKGTKITEVFPENNTGLITSRDKFAFGFKEGEVIQRVRNFTNISVEQARKNYKLRDVRERTLEESHEQVRKLENLEDHIEQCYYRPFDIRPLFYHESIVRWPVFDFMSNLRNKDNVALITSRLTKGETFKHVQVSTNIVEVICMSSKTSNNGYVFPVYLYPEKKQGQMFELDDDGSAFPLSDKGRRPNLNPEFVKDMSDKLGLTFITDGMGDLSETFGPEDVFHYAYAVFHSPTYRERYAEFLKIDFPRLPLTSDVALFKVLCGYGAELVQWHLMTHADISKTTVTFDIGGSDEVISKYPKYEADEERVYINKTQYFANVPQDVWDFHIGGYQVLHKWLKDRKGRTLDFNDVRHYQRVVKALQETMHLMDKIDDAIPGFPIV